MMKHKKRGQLPAVLRTEMRRTIALKSFSKVYPKNAKLAQQHQCIEDDFHGNKSSGAISQKDMLCHGEGVYSEMFVPVQASSNENSLKLKSLYSRSVVSYFSGKEITSEVLERKFFKGKELMKGRALYDLAAQSLRTIRRACVKVKKYINEDGSIKESNRTIYDVATLILDDMYEELKGRNQIYDVEDDESDKKEGECKDKDGDTVNNDSNNHEREGAIKVPDGDFSAKRRPEEWMFAGYMAFMLFGPLAPYERRIDFLKLKDRSSIVDRKEITPIDVKNDPDKCFEIDGRNENPIEQDSKGDQIIALKKSASVNKDGAAKGTHDTATLDVQTIRLNARIQEGDFFALKSEADLLGCQITRAFSLAEKSGKDDDWERYNKLELEMDAIRKTMKDLRQSQPQSESGLKRTNDLIEPNIDGKSGDKNELAPAKTKQATETITLSNARSENNAVSIIVRFS
mmetsp:Transcript_2097/g.3084  ORF Transcript_2097/g.3084 Transcript_2097/m.3084 type:complete len:458 (+) Transcript_2097:61-1434(+)|eukprot:CAMPEP_0194258692 /NCGR_PEP_ID=MMETSP0158-20130606/41828_1 /TAXON_ID=33649 /ORGANISM="Thalassionema nitzschioides, Strain L26-B" /LENGTH=457 /DNA_ID=CAMNT_0038998191 /DNA_START=20 /DNA_END=1393 /DNA_ORIENTATION=+